MAKHNHDALESLREALRQSPDNLPLRRHLAETLLNSGRLDEAEAEFLEAVRRAPDSFDLLLGLASTYFALGKDSHSLVIVEDMMKKSDTPARAYMLHCRLLLRSGNIDRAVQQYKNALDEDSDIADEALAEQLGIEADDESDVVEGRIRAPREEAAHMSDVPIERPVINFGDVGGMDSLKEEIRMKIIYPLEHREMFEAYGKKIGGGILMYGPPGCGKTHLARATAGEIHAGFISVGISDVLDMWIGNSERNLHELFEQARRNNPCVLFFDEVDALGASRSDMRQSAGRQLINQFLAEMDGVDASNEGVLILAATNAPWHIDSAFRRPGRFDRVLFVPPPDTPARAAILRILCRGKPVKDIDHEQIGKKTEGFSGADLQAVVDVAIEGKLQEAMKTGIPAPLTTKDLLTAAKSLRATTREWFSTARNYALYSNQGGMYDPILKHLNLE